MNREHCKRCLKLCECFIFFYVLSNEKLLNRFSDESKLWPIRIQGSVSVPSNHVGSLCSVVPIPM